MKRIYALELFIIQLKTTYKCHIKKYYFLKQKKIHMKLKGKEGIKQSNLRNYYFLIAFQFLLTKQALICK